MVFEQMAAIDRQDLTQYAHKKSSYPKDIQLNFPNQAYQQHEETYVLVSITY